MAGTGRQGSSGMAELRRRVESWRRKGSSRLMPSAWWRSAARLADSEGVWAVARALGLNYGHLRRRVQGRHEHAQRERGVQPLFVELGRAGAVLGSGCVVEIEDRCGLRMRVRFEGQGAGELAALGGELWKACR